MSRGPLTYQWRPCHVHGAKPRPMNPDRMTNQLAVVTGVPEGTTPGDLMRLMNQTIWIPGLSEALTEIRFEDLGLGKVLPRLDASLKDVPQAHPEREVNP